MISVPPCRMASLPSTLNLRIKKVWLAVQSQVVRSVMPVFDVSLDQSPSSHSSSFKWFDLRRQVDDRLVGTFNQPAAVWSSPGQRRRPGRRPWPRPV